MRGALLRGPPARQLRTTMTDRRTDVFRVGLMSIQPSQLYLCREKLEAVERALAEGSAFEPVPVVRLDGRLTLSDGHTRAFAAIRRGDRTVPARWETDGVDRDAYRICVGWCTEAGIRTAADLKDRIVPATEYATRWIARCRAMHLDLTRRRRAEETR